MNPKIFEASELPDAEKVYLKKDLLGWRVVEPPTKFWHYIFGNKRGFINLLIYVVIAMLIYFGVTELISSYEMIAANPCDFCSEVTPPF